MCPTTIGRLHTRVATLIFLPALVGVALSLLTSNPDWIALIGIYLLLGTALDALVYSWAIKYQPPWMTFVLALVELGLLYVIANEAGLTLTPAEAIGLFWVAWVLAVWTKIALLPILSLTYLESAGEFRRTEWSIPPSHESTPVFSLGSGRGHGEVVKAASTAANPGGSSRSEADA